jgi:signal transduction histidine kinase
LQGVAGEHRLSHAVGEWKADLTQRLAAAQVQLVWTFTHDRDLPLSMVQWSALTRVLRELASNALQHARATCVAIQISLDGPVLLLRVADDGCGRAPETWSHGLGLGGVRKRVKLIGGEVTWHEQLPQGIVCEVRVADFAQHGDWPRSRPA